MLHLKQNDPRQQNLSHDKFKFSNLIQLKMNKFVGCLVIKTKKCELIKKIK